VSHTDHDENHYEHRGSMAEGQKKSSPTIYEIRIEGHLGGRWADRFEGMTFTHESDGTTTLYGPLTDQAALHGLLNGIRDLGLPLLSVQRVSLDSKERSI
jgi:hypothetical protein